MSTVLAVGLISTLAFGGDPIQSGCGYLYQPAFEIKGPLRGPLRPYSPQPGDMIFESDDRIGMTIGHNLAKTGQPHHSLIVFQRAEGGLAVLQAGGFDEHPTRVGIHDVYENLLNEEAKTGRKDKRIYVRERKTPLTPEQSELLTQWAAHIADCRFSRYRLFALMSPVRAKGPLRTAFVGKVNYDRGGFFCSEQVATALAYAHIIDPELARPGATFPRDLFFGESCNYWVNRSMKPLNCDWHPPARWTSNCGE